MITAQTFLAFGMSLACGFPLPDWTTSQDPPCFLNDTENPLVTEALKQSLEKISTRVNVLKNHVESHIQTMKQHYCIDVSDEEIATASFMDNIVTNADYNNDNQYDICNDFDTFLGTMGNTYETLNQLAGYFQQLRHAAIDESSLKRLISSQGDVYDVMCSIKIVLRSKGQVHEATVPSANLSNMFIQYRQGSISRCIQQTSEYVTMLDAQRVSKQLDTLFKSLLARHLDC